MSKGTAKVVVRLVVTILVFGACVWVINKDREVDLASAQATKTPKEDQRPKPKPENNYFFTERGPSGDWFFEVADFELQSRDPNIPVVIGGIGSYMGRGDWQKHLMIENIVLVNRTPKVIKSFRLGWIIMSAEDHRVGKNREASLLEGQTDLIEPGFTNFGGRTKPFYFEVIKAAKPLIKNGILSGNFAIRIRLIEVRFEDGSGWTENQALALRRRYSHTRTPQLPTGRCTNDQCNFHLDGQGYCGEVSLNGYHCQKTEL